MYAYGRKKLSCIAITYIATIFIIGLWKKVGFFHNAYVLVDDEIFRV
jgi:hypothetical protein